MKSIALIHTVKTEACSFDQQLKDYVGEPVKIHNLWDDFLANNPNEIGEFTIENRCRLYNDIKHTFVFCADETRVQKEEKEEERRCRFQRICL